MSCLHKGSDTSLCSICTGSIGRILDENMTVINSLFCLCVENERSVRRVCRCSWCQTFKSWWMYTEKFFWKVYVFRTSATWLLWTYGGWLLGGWPSWSQWNCQCVYLEWARYILHNFEWNKYQHPLLSYHFSSLYNLFGVASFEELSKTCCHLQEHIKWQKIDNRWCLCWSHIHQQCQSQPTCKKKTN